MRRLFTLSAFFFVVASILGIPARAAHAQADQCFAQTGQCISGRFAEYWQQNGGLPVFGYPISPATQQTTPEGTFLTQYFERNRFELHPENARPYDVLLGRLGVDRLVSQGRDWFSFPKAVPDAAHYFAETGHAVVHVPFWQYWSSKGLDLDGKPGFTAAESLALFGLPISEPSTETNASGDTILTQHFERARFEDHGAKGVLLGLLGTETSGITPPPIPSPNPSTPPAPPAPPMDDAQYRQYLRANFNRIGGYTLQLEDVTLHRLDSGSIAVSFYVTIDDVEYLLDSATDADKRAWGQALLNELKTRYPTTTTLGSLSWDFYTYDVMEEDDCVYVGDFEAGEGWYHSVDFVQTYYNAGSKTESVDICI